VADPHSFAPSARGRLDNHRIADPLRGPLSVLFVFYGRGCSRDDGQAAFTHGFARLHLVSHKPDVFRGGADKGYLAGFADFREMGVFRQETVAGMDGVNIGDFRGRDDRGYV
jgi:hypothetical protein